MTANLSFLDFIFWSTHTATEVLNMVAAAMNGHNFLQLTNQAVSLYFCQKWGRGQLCCGSKVMHSLQIHTQIWIALYCALNEKKEAAAEVRRIVPEPDALIQLMEAE